MMPLFILRQSTRERTHQVLGAAKTATKSPLINALPDLHMHTTLQDHCPACYGPLYYEELAHPQYEAPSATTPTPAPAPASSARCAARTA